MNHLVSKTQGVCVLDFGVLNCTTIEALQKKLQTFEVLELLVVSNWGEKEMR